MTGGDQTHLVTRRIILSQRLFVAVKLKPFNVDRNVTDIADNLVSEP